MNEDHLRATWADPRGLWGWLTTVDHKRITGRYIVTTIILLLLAGVLALDMRLQLSGANLKRMSPQLFNESFALHG